MSEVDPSMSVNNNPRTDKPAIPSILSDASTTVHTDAPRSRSRVLETRHSADPTTSGTCQTAPLATAGTRVAPIRRSPTPPRSPCRSHTNGPSRVEAMAAQARLDERRHAVRRSSPAVCGRGSVRAFGRVVAWQELRVRHGRCPRTASHGLSPCEPTSSTTHPAAENWERRSGSRHSVSV